jgi:hypothetical protein
MKEYLDITNELTQVTKEYKIFQERYASVLSNLNEFNGAAAGLPSFRFSIENELILIEFIDRKFQVEFNYLRKNGKPSGQLSIKESTNEKKNEVLAFQEFEANGDVMNSTLSLKEAIETMAVILNLVMSAVES